MNFRNRVELTIENGVAHVQLVRPDKMNALDPEMFAAILEAGSHLVSAKREPPLPDDGPGVEPIVHAHEGHAGLGVAGQDRRRDRGRAAVARQEGRVEVERAVRQL